MIEVIPQKTKPMIVLYREGEELIAQLNGRHTMKEELSITADLIDNCVQENAHSALNQEEYNKQYNSLVERYTGLKNRYDEITEIIVQKRSGQQRLHLFLEQLEQTEHINEGYTDILLRPKFRSLGQNIGV